MQAIKSTRWQLNGFPTHCMLETCKQPFNGSCFHATDHRYYCDAACYAEAENHAFRRLAKIACPTRPPS